MPAAAPTTAAPAARSVRRMRRRAPARADLAPEAEAERASSRAQRCRALTRRPDGSFDQAAYDRCMRGGGKRVDLVRRKRRSAYSVPGVGRSHSAQALRQTL